MTFGGVSEETYIDQELDLVLLEIAADLGRQKDTRSGAEFTILLVQFTLKDKFFKVDESHGHRRFLVATFILGQLSYLPFQAAGRWGKKAENEEGKKRKGEIKIKLMRGKKKTRAVKLNHLYCAGTLLAVFTS